MSHIVEYLSSPRSRRLATLKLSGNSLGPRGASKIARRIKRDNFNIMNLEMYGVRSHQGGRDVESSESSSGSSSGVFHSSATSFEEDLQYTLTRNELLQRHTRAAALRLLRYSRALLLKPRRSNEDEGSRSPFHIQSLPAELQLQILSFTVDTLSTNQCIRIFKFASDSNTLPTLLPDLRQGSSGGIPEPSLLERSSAPFTLSPRDANRTQWLQNVGCDLYET